MDRPEERVEESIRHKCVEYTLNTPWDISLSLALKRQIDIIYASTKCLFSMINDTSFPSVLSIVVKIYLIIFMFASKSNVHNV